MVVSPYADGATALRGTTGVPRGLTVATDAFNRSCEGTIAQYKERTVGLSCLLQAKLGDSLLLSMTDTVPLIIMLAMLPLRRRPLGNKSVQQAVVVLEDVMLALHIRALPPRCLREGPKGR